ncbi:MAG: hypothetical protein KDH97_19310 [Calditrichaeota bacterium]|nr:hypothetical protein [Calditrichota bacterium]
MKCLACLTLTLLLLSGGGFAQEIDSAAVMQEHQEIEASFETVVNRFAEFFQVKQKLLCREESKKSPTGAASYIAEYTCKEVNYGVSSSGNTIIPYTAQIVLTMTKLTNQACGDIPGVTLLGLPAGWGSEAEALANDRSACYKSAIRPVPYQVQLRFDYKDGAWSLKQVQNLSGKAGEGAIAAAFGLLESPALEIATPEGQAFNQPWGALLPK